MENENRTQTTDTNDSQPARPAQSAFSAWLDQVRDFLKDRFSLDEDTAQRDEVVASISKGVEFRGVNLWVLIFAAMVASLGLNVNSAAVIIGAMLISPIMGPIMGVGLSLGINDFELMKKSLRNFALMFIVAIVTATAYFFISPLSSNSSELLARTTPTTYDLLIAFFGGLAGMVAQTRQDRTSTAISGGGGGPPPPPTQRMPMSSGSQGRACATNQNPVCWVAVARSLRYSVPSTSKVIGRQR